MSDWLTQYTAALDARHRRESANSFYINAYSRLADRTVSFEEATTSPQTGPPRASQAPQTQTSDAQFSRLQTDLSTAQRERTELSTRLARLETQLSDASSRATKSEKRTATLEREKRESERKLRDRDEEIRGKDRLVTEAHDEMVGLNLQLNIAEERAGKLTAENEELVRRWMERMGREAEQMNQDSQWT